MKDEKPKLVKLLGVLRELREKEQAVLDEIDVLIGGGVGIGEKLKQCYRAFAEAWGLVYPGAAYVWNYAKDAPQMKRLLKTLSAEEIGARAASYAASREEFITRAKHSFPMFVATINQHASVRAPEAELDLEADAAETQRKRREIRR
jgi:hypothetical protein